MLDVICPGCAFEWPGSGQDGVRTCPSCGYVLGSTEAVGQSSDQAASGNSSDADAAPNAADAALMADLREAFGGPMRAGGWGGAMRGLQGAGSSGAAGWPVLPDACAASLSGRIGDFEILEEIGRGGMGVVYRARQISLRREVALKVLPNYSRHSPAAVRRFRAEAQAAARLHHTNVVSIYAQGECGDQYYYAMELVDGVSLDAVIRSRPELLARSGPGFAGNVDGRVEWTRADYQHMARLVAEVADALDCAHRHGIIHRDVKPHNLLLSQDDRLHLTDFGLARLTDEPHFTLSGEILGTPAYLSPEQVHGDSAIDHRTDVYSLGVTLYELITRHRPFSGETREQVLSAITGVEPVSPRRWSRSIPPELETICLRAMDRDPGRRHGTAALLAEDLRRFADGRPILSRRTTYLGRTIKWVRRHKPASAAIAACAAVVVLAAGLAVSEASKRHAEARRLLERVYERLAYYDFRHAELMNGDIDRAAALGAPAAQLDLVRALAALGRKEYAGATELLEGVLRVEPGNQRALYMLAWARARKRQMPESDAAFAAAEGLGAPVTADAWFFRGVAIHFKDALRAISSYQEANALRARERAFYPQAILHLARARNQQLYSTRSLVFFSEAEADLRQLMEYGYYESAPYYLRSIACRLAAEINGGLRCDPLVRDLYAQSLQWARMGQEVEPSSDRPITAEAECLESMGEYDAAIEARTRAIQTAAVAADRWEGYHFRWRLYYWTDRLEAALTDLEVLASFDPQDMLYAYIYPAMVYAEMGRLGEACALARRLGEERPRSAIALIRSASALRLLGRAEEACKLLDAHAAEVDFDADLGASQSAEWMQVLYQFCRGQAGFEELDAQAQRSGQAHRLWAEANFHAALLQVARGDGAEAWELLRRAYQSFDGEERYTYQARILLIKAAEKSSWPPWLELSWHEASGSPNRPAIDGPNGGTVRRGNTDEHEK